MFILSLGIVYSAVVLPYLLGASLIKRYSIFFSITRVFVLNFLRILTNRLARLLNPVNVSIGKKHLKIDCITSRGEKYTTFLPYSRKQRLKSKFFISTVKGVTDEEFEGIPGVPLLVTANDLGVDKILIMRKDSKEIVEEITGDEVSTLLSSHRTR